MDRNATRRRCDWVGADPLYRSYHDREWGVPVHDDRLLFEFLILEGAQAGLSWITILKKRDAYRAAFAGFDPEAVAGFDGAKAAELLANPGIVRNRLKVESSITNARSFLKVSRPQTARVPFRWQHHLLRPHAGGRHGERSHGELFPLAGGGNEGIMTPPRR